MPTRARLRRNTYYDSITLMALAQALKELPGVEDAGVVMATELNCELLRNAGLLPEAFLAKQETPPGPADLLIAVRATDAVCAEAALASAEQRLAAPALGAWSRERSPAGSWVELAPTRATSGIPARSLELALRRDPDANLAVISVAGEHAWLEAEQALRRGLHVFLFSDNVPIEREQALKALAAQRGLLLMGPDCGTAIIAGVGLGFANVVPRGPIGIVGASGTGIQQLTCLIAAAGLGISQAIGIGGRDLTAAIGGIMTRRGLEVLANDPQTQVIILVSKPPSERVAREILAQPSPPDPLANRAGPGELSRGETAGKPVIAVFPGADPGRFAGVAGSVRLARTLTEAAALAVSLASGDPERVPGWDMVRKGDERTRPTASQRYVRALYSGGTLCDEAMRLLSERLGPIASNIPLQPEWALAPGETFRGHTALDLGADEFTRGRPHPMIDPSLRLQYLARAAADAATGVILLDIVLGFGAHLDPAAVYAPAIAQARATAAAAGRTLPVVVALCGTEGDPQGLSAQRAALEAAGARVFASNAAAATIAGVDGQL
jgi:FdrA protein